MHHHPVPNRLDANTQCGDNRGTAASRPVSSALLTPHSQHIQSVLLVVVLRNTSDSIHADAPPTRAFHYSHVFRVFVWRCPSRNSLCLKGRLSYEVLICHIIAKTAIPWTCINGIGTAAGNALLKCSFAPHVVPKLILFIRTPELGARSGFYVPVNVVSTDRRIPLELQFKQLNFNSPISTEKLPFHIAAATEYSTAPHPVVAFSDTCATRGSKWG